MVENMTLVLYILGSILLIVLIILGIKLIITMDKVNKLVDKFNDLANNINTKVNSLNGFFSIIDFTSNKLNMISDKIVDGVTGIVKKIFYKKKEEEFDDE